MRTLINQEMGASLRILERDGQPWFVAKDVCTALEIKRPDSAIRMLDDDEKGTQTLSTLGGTQQMTIVSESGLYALIMRSYKPAARKFRKWVTAEVLPEIRRSGSYGGEEPEYRRLLAEVESTAQAAAGARARLADFRAGLAARYGLATAPGLPDTGGKGAYPIRPLCDLPQIRALPAPREPDARVAKRFLADSAARILYERSHRTPPEFSLAGMIQVSAGFIDDRGHVRFWAETPRKGDRIFAAICGRPLYDAWVCAGESGGAAFTDILGELRRLKAWIPPANLRPAQHRMTLGTGRSRTWWVLDYEELDPELTEIFYAILASEAETLSPETTTTQPTEP